MALQHKVFFLLMHIDISIFFILNGECRIVLVEVEDLIKFFLFTPITSGLH